MSNNYREYSNKRYEEFLPHMLFETPLWHLKKELPDGIYESALDFEKKNEGKGRTVSNIGGYQSHPFGIEDVPFGDYICECTSFLPDHYFANGWLNINRNNDFNAYHDHPGADLTFIWFITDNNGELNIRNPHSFSRHKMYKALTGEAYNGISPICTAGDMLLFPADVLHSVSATNKPEPRISISFNIIFK